MSDKEGEPESIILNGNAYNEIRLTDFKEILIIGDGNCLFRCLSLFKDKTQDNYNYYRQLIFNYINSNKSKLQIFFPKESNKSDENYATRYNEFILSFKKDQN